MKFKGKHHTSVCDKDTTNGKGNAKKVNADEEGEGSTLYAMVEKSVTYPVVLVMVNGVKCRALVDTGAGSCYASSALIERLSIKPERQERRRIEMLMHTTSCKVEIYKLDIANLDGSFHLPVEVSKAEKDVLLKVSNPNYVEMVQKFKHLKGIKVEDNDPKSELPVHLILGLSEYSKIKMEVVPRVGNLGEPVAELTRLGRIFMSPGYEMENSLYLTQSSHEDYDRLCSLEVLRLEDNPQGDQEAVYRKFKEQLKRSTEGWYETGLMWKIGHPPLNNNKAASLARLSNLLSKLKRNPELFVEYDSKIKEQLTVGIVEHAANHPDKSEFYIPHKPVLREAAESTELRIVYDASSGPNSQSPSLNGCLETGPPLQNFDVECSNKKLPVTNCSDW